MRAHRIDADEVQAFLKSLFEDDFHAKRILSLSNATLGAIHATSLAVHAIGAGLAKAEGLNTKHAIKQVDRMLSNSGIDVWQFYPSWVPYVVGQRTEAIVAMDWTDFDKDDQTTIALHLITKHGRATPLVWLTVPKSTLKDRRNDFEDMVLKRLAGVMPPGVKVTILADRGFGDTNLYDFLTTLNFGFVIRFRENITVVSAEGESKPASEWVPPNGRVRLMHGAKVTQNRYAVPAVVLVKAKKMKDAWCLAASDTTAAGAEIVKQYGHRFKIEETFRDAKDLRFGMGLAATRIRNSDRRDRLLLVGALAIALITLLGAAGESIGMDRMLKANTVKTRTHSLFRQGCEYYDLIPMMKPERLVPLVERFAQLLREQRVFRETLGLI